MKSVLVVDDDVETRDTIAELLEEEGYPVRVASDGAIALAHLASGEIGLALVDLLMPEMNGWSLLERLSTDDSIARVPVVVLTALSRISPPIGVPMLRKPFELDALLGLVRQSFIDSPSECDDAMLRPLQARPRPRLGLYPLALAKCGNFEDSKGLEGFRPGPKKHAES